MYIQMMENNMRIDREDGMNEKSGMVRGMREFFKDYKGCRNCKHKTDPYVMCEYGKDRSGKLICPGWEKGIKQHGKPFN